MAQQAFQGFFSDCNLILDSDDESKGKLYLGNIKSAQPYNLPKYKIGAVLTVAAEPKIKYPQEIIFRQVIIDDHEEQNIAQHFEECFEFINEHLQNTNVLVHCMAGISRSASVVIAYVMRHNGLNYQQALEFVKVRRNIIWPNEGFRQQLQNFL